MKFQFVQFLQENKCQSANSFDLSDTWRKSKRSGGTKQEKNREREVNETTNRGGKSFKPESDDEMAIPLGFLLGELGFQTSRNLQFLV